MRKGSTGSSRGINRFIDELAGVLRRAKATGTKCVRSHPYLTGPNSHRPTLSREERPIPICESIEALDHVAMFPQIDLIAVQADHLSDLR